MGDHGEYKIYIFIFNQAAQKNKARPTFHTHETTNTLDMAKMTVGL